MQKRYKFSLCNVLCLLYTICCISFHNLLLKWDAKAKAMTGTFPHYNDRQLDFAASKAILARGSVSRDSYRAGFDVSLPLFGESLPMRRIETGDMKVESSTRYFLTFKGRVDIQCYQMAKFDPAPSNQAQSKERMGSNFAA